MATMRVHIVADVDVIDAPEGFSDYIVADALAQTLGGLAGPTRFFAEMVGPDGTDVAGTFGLREIGAAAGECADAGHQMYPVEVLHP